MGDYRRDSSMWYVFGRSCYDVTHMDNEIIIYWYIQYLGLMKLLIDTREKKEHVTKLTNALKKAKIPYEIKQLDVGDYVVLNDKEEPVGLVEHKSYADFVSSIQNRHLESQLKDMDKSDIPQYLFINGTYAQFRNTPAIKYFKIGLQGVNTYKVTYSHKARIVEFDNESQLIQGVITLCKHLTKKAHLESYIIPERVKLSGDPSIDMFLGVEGIGIKCAEKLVNKGVSFGYLYAVAHSLEPDVAQILIKEQFGITVKKPALEWLGKVQ